MNSEVTKYKFHTEPKDNLLKRLKFYSQIVTVRYIIVGLQTNVCTAEVSELRRNLPPNLDLEKWFNKMKEKAQDLYTAYYPLPHRKSDITYYIKVTYYG